ncbi:MAG: hypothetical protein ACRCSV_01490 [Chlamydiales bacterium]
MTTMQYIFLILVLMVVPGLAILCISCLPESIRKKFKEKPNRATFFIIGVISVILLFLYQKASF